MLYGPKSLELPPHISLKSFEGKGNWAIDKYYKFPYRYFYRYKLKMIVDMLRRDGFYYNILDFGSGPGIFTKELKKHAIHVKSFDKDDIMNPSWKFDIIVCSSVLEFCNLYYTIRMLKSLLRPGGKIIVGSPMKNKLTDLYFDKIDDQNERHSHHEIIESIGREMEIEDYKEWLGLYFALRAS